MSKDLTWLLSSGIDWNKVFSTEVLIILLSLSVFFACLGFYCGLAFGDERVAWILTGGLLGFFWPITLAGIFLICGIVVATSPIWLSVVWYFQRKEDREERERR